MRSLALYFSLRQREEEEEEEKEKEKEGKASFHIDGVYSKRKRLRSCCEEPRRRYSRRFCSLTVECK